MSDEENSCCFYCGDWFQCRDHFIPVSYLRIKRDYRAGETVKSCTICNLLLSDKMFSSMEERSGYLLRTYLHKYKKLLRLPHWEEDEIDALDYSLRTLIECKQYAKQIMKAKISNLEVTSNGQSPIPLAYTYNPAGLLSVARLYVE